MQDEHLIPLKRPTRVTAAGDEEITNGGLGNFDVGWLNSRSDNVGRKKESQMWAEVRTMLEQKGSNDAAASDADAAMTDQHDTNGVNGHGNE